MCSHEAQKLGDVHHGAQHRRRRKWDAALPMEGVNDYALSLPNANRLWEMSEAMTRI